MKIKTNKISANLLLLPVIAFSFISSAEATVIYSFLNGAPFDGGTGAASLAASDSITDGSTTFNISTVDIIGLDNGTTEALTSTAAGAGHATNIFSDATGLGVFSRETTNAVDDGNAFDRGEAWQFSFDHDVVLNAVNLNLLEGTQTFNLTIFDGSNGGSGTVVGMSSGDNTGINANVSANTVLEFRVGSASERARVSSLTVTAVPEPSSFALIAGMLGLTWVMIRRRA